MARKRKSSITTMMPAKQRSPNLKGPGKFRAHMDTAKGLKGHSGTGYTRVGKRLRGQTL